MYNTCIFFSGWTKLQTYILYRIHYNLRNLTTLLLSLPVPQQDDLLFLRSHVKCIRLFVQWVVSFFYIAPIDSVTATTPVLFYLFFFLLVWQRLDGWFSRLMKPQISLFLIVTLQLFVVNARINYIKKGEREKKPLAMAAAWKKCSFFFWLVINGTV